MMWRPAFLFVVSATLILGLLSVSAARAEEVTQPYKGLTLNANLMMAEGKGYGDPFVLMTHGTLAHNGMEIIRTMQRLLVEAGFNTLAINLSLGVNDRHGMYPCPTPHTHRHSDGPDEIGLWLRWLENRGATEVILFGHSRGANQTAWFAAENPSKAVRKVLLVAPPGWDEQKTRDEYKTRYGKDLEGPLSKARGLVAAGKGKQLMEHVDFLYCKDTRVSADSFLDYYRAEPRFDTPSLLSRIAAPVLVIAGSEDTTVPDVAQRVAPLADGKKLRLVVVEGADHFFRDFYAEDAVEAMVNFIED